MCVPGPAADVEPDGDTRHYSRVRQVSVGVRQCQGRTRILVAGRSLLMVIVARGVGQLATAGAC